MIDWLTDAFSALQAWFFEAVVQPLVFAVGLGGLTEDAEPRLLDRCVA